MLTQLRDRMASRVSLVFPSDPARRSQRLSQSVSLVMMPWFHLSRSQMMPRRQLRWRPRLVPGLRVAAGVVPRLWNSKFSADSKLVPDRFYSARGRVGVICGARDILRSPLPSRETLALCTWGQIRLGTRISLLFGQRRRKSSGLQYLGTFALCSERIPSAFQSRWFGVRKDPLRSAKVKQWICSE